MDGFRNLPGLDLHRHAVAQQVVNGLIVPVEVAAVVVCLGAQLVKGSADLSGRVAAFGQPRREQAFFDIAVAIAVGPIAQVSVVKFVAEQCNDAILSGALRLADVAHINRIRPVSSSCIMPCFDLACLAELRFQGRDLRIHAGKDGGDSGLFPLRWGARAPQRRLAEFC